MLLAKKKNILVDKHKFSFILDNKVNCVNWKYDLFDELSSYINKYNIDIIIKPSLCCETIFSQVNNNEISVLNELKKDLSIRKPEIYDIFYQKNNSAIIIWFPEIKKEKINSWVKRHNSKILSIDTVLNKFSFLCGDNEGIIIDLNDHFGIIRKKDGYFEDMFCVSISNIEKDIISCFNYLEKFGKTTIYGNNTYSIDKKFIKNIFKYKGLKYDINNLEEFLLKDI